MGKGKYNIEDLFQESFKEYKNIPNEHVLKKIKFRLWMDDFFSLRLNKVNILYASMVIAGILFVFKKDSDVELLKENAILSQSEEKLSASPEQENTNTIAKSNTENISSQKELAAEAPAAVADFSVSVTSGCAPLLVTFNNKSLNTTEYKWDFDNGIFSTDKNPSQLFSKPGKYQVKLKAKNNFNVDQKIAEIHVLGSPKALCTINTLKSSIKNKTVSFTNSSKNSAQYLWNFGDGNTSEEKSATHTYSDFGIYNVTLIAKNETGCIDSVTIINRFIEKNYLLAFPNSFRPNPIDPENNGFYLSSENERFVFYPKNNGVSGYNLEIFAGNGMKVFSSKDIKQGWNGYIKGRIAPPGVYFYKSSGKYPNGESFEYQGNFKVIVDNYDYY